MGESENVALPTDRDHDDESSDVLVDSIGEASSFPGIRGFY